MRRAPEPRIELSLSLRYTAERSWADPGDSTEYILPIMADIMGTVDSQEDIHPERDEPAIRLGTLELLRIKVGNAINDGAPLWDVFDGSQETMDAGSVLYDATFDEFRPAIGRLFPDAMAQEDILLVHRLVVLPFARGNDVGLAALYHSIRDWESGCALVLLKAYPLQFESSARESPLWKIGDLASFPQDEPLATKRLRAHYERLGFRRIERTAYLGLSPAARWPALDPETLPTSVCVPRSALSANGLTHE